MKKIIALLVCAIMIFTSLTTVVIADTITFTDVDKSTTEGEAIYKLADAGIVNGNGDGTFTPKNGITRAELCKIVNITYNYTEKDKVQFKDVKSTDWFADHVLIAKKAGYIKGYDDGTFRGDDNITREEFCAIITRINGLYDLGLSANVADNVSDWAKNYVDIVIANQLMTLEEGNKFRATEDIKRGEVAVVVAKFVKEDTPIIGGETIEPTKPESDKKPTGGGGGGGGGGGSSSSDDDDEEEELTPEEIKEMNADVLDELTAARDSLTANITSFGSETDTEFMIIKNVIGVLNGVISDGSKYVFTKGDIYVNYESKISETFDLFESLDAEKGTFVNNVSKLDKTTFDFLCDFFNIDPNDYK